MSLPATTQVVYPPAAGAGPAPHPYSSHHHHPSQSLGRPPVGPPSPHTSLLPHLAHAAQQQSSSSQHNHSASVSPVHPQLPHYQSHGHNRNASGGHGYGAPSGKNSTGNHHRTNQHANANVNGHALTPPPAHHLSMSSHPSQSTYSTRSYANFTPSAAGTGQAQSIYVQQTPNPPPPYPPHSSASTTAPAPTSTAQSVSNHLNNQQQGQGRLPSIRDLDFQYQTHKAQAQAQSQGQALNMGQAQSQNMSSVPPGGQAASPTYPTPTSLYGSIPSGGSSIVGTTNGGGSVNGAGAIGRSSPPTPASNSAYPQPYPSPAQSYIAGPSSSGSGGGARGSNGLAGVGGGGAGGGPPQSPYPPFASPHTPHSHSSNTHSHQQPSYSYPYDYEYSSSTGAYTPASTSTGLPGSSGGQASKSMSMHYQPALGPTGQSTASTYANAPTTPTVTHGDQSWHTTHSSAHGHPSYAPPPPHHRMTPSPASASVWGGLPPSQQAQSTYVTRQPTGASSSALAGAVGSGGPGESGYEPAQGVPSQQAPLVSPVREEIMAGPGSGVINTAGGTVSGGEISDARAYYIPKIQELCGILYEFAKKYSSQGIAPPPAELSEMSRKAEQVVKLLEAYKNSTVNEGAQDLSVSLSASGSLRQPKRPWEEIDHDGEGDDILGPSPYGSRGKMEMGDVDDFGAGSAAEKDMALIRSKRATNLNMLAPGTTKGKYRKRSQRATPPGKCHSCNSRETPEWRRGPDGARTLCNACGLHYAKLCRKREKALQSNNVIPPEIDMETLRASTRAANEREQMKRDREMERRKGEKSQLYTGGDHSASSDPLGGGGGGSAGFIVASGDSTGAAGSVPGSVPVSMSNSAPSVVNVSSKMGPVQEWRS